MLENDFYFSIISVKRAKRSYILLKKQCSISLLFILCILLSACSSIGENSKLAVSDTIQDINFSTTPEEQRVIIFNHGIRRPQLKEPCHEDFNQPPRSLLALKDKKTLVYSLCSTSVESPAISSAGKQVYLRRVEINYAINSFLERGIKPKNLFLAGHSNGGWTSLMMMKDVNTRFNGVIAYAPAFAGKRSEVSFAPWWRKTVRPKQIKEMLHAPAMDALVFAYENDAFNRPQDLQFLEDNYPLELLFGRTTGVDLVSYGCGLRNSHVTHRYDCRQQETTQLIKTFINDQIENW